MAVAAESLKCPEKNRKSYKYCSAEYSGRNIIPPNTNHYQGQTYWNSELLESTNETKVVEEQ